MRTFGSANSEYLPTPDDNNGHTSPTSHNGQGKIFTLKPALDPDTSAILHARKSALGEPNDRLNRSAKAAFCEIIDRALDPRFYDYKGVVTISDTVLARTFSVSARTVYTWKKALESAGYVWTSGKLKSNMWPITTYHLSCLHKPKQLGKTDSDGTYGGGNLRSRPEVQPLGCRPAPSPAVVGSDQPAPISESAVLQAISGETRKKLPLSPEENFGSDPKKISGETRSEFRARPEENFGSDPKKISGETRSGDRATPEADCRHIETRDRLKEPETLKRLSKRSESAEPEPAKPAGKGARKLTPEAESFMRECLDVLGSEEMRKNGGLWLTNFRASSSTAWAVIRETGSAAKERRIKTTPAKFATDYWKSLSSARQTLPKKPAAKATAPQPPPERRSRAPRHVVAKGLGQLREALA